MSATSPPAPLNCLRQPRGKSDPGLGSLGEGQAKEAGVRLFLGVREDSDFKVIFYAFVLRIRYYMHVFFMYLRTFIHKNALFTVIKS